MTDSTWRQAPVAYLCLYLCKACTAPAVLPTGHHATSLDELNSAALHDNSDSAAQEAPLSKAERAAVTVAAAESEARQAGAQGGAEVPFKASEALLAALSGFAEGALIIVRGCWAGVLGKLRTRAPPAFHRTWTRVSGFTC